MKKLHRMQIMNLPKLKAAPYYVLTRHFFRRLFQNDFIAFEDQMKERSIGILALLSIICMHASNAALIKYSVLPDQGTSWVEKCFLLCLFMVFMALVTVLEWDVIFPDSRDYINLAPLPVKIKTLFLAKFTSLIMFAGTFALGVTFLSALTFSYYLPKWKSDSFIYGLRFTFSHILASLAAVLFIFFFMAFVIGFFMTALGHRAFNRISIYIRGMLLMGLIFIIAIFIFNMGYLNTAFDTLLGKKANQSNFLLVIPPMWFTGLYETLIGNEDPIFHKLSYYAILALLLSISGFFITAGLGYRRYIKKMVTEKIPKVARNRVKEALSNLFNQVFLKNPIQRAVYYFFRATLKRSMFHKMRLVSFLAVALGVILILMIALFESFLIGSQYNRTLLAVPLILSLFLLLGIKKVVDIPVSLEANWVFQLTETEEIRHYKAGVRKGILTFILAPLFVFLFVFYFWLWGGQASFFHCLFGLAVSLFLMEIFFFKYHKIPFTCSFLPGKEKLHVYWLPYVFLLAIYFSVFTKIEASFFSEPLRFYLFYLGAIIMILGLRMYQDRSYYHQIHLKFEEEPELVMVGMMRDN